MPKYTTARQSMATHNRNMVLGKNTSAIVPAQVSHPTKGSKRHYDGIRTDDSEVLVIIILIIIIRIIKFIVIILVYRLKNYKAYTSISA